MKIIGTSKKSTPCIWTCIGKGIEGLSKYINCPIIIYDQTDFLQNKIQPDNDKIIFIFEAGIPHHCNFPLNIAKRYWPNSIFIPLSTDTIFWRMRNQHQMDLQYIDLFLDPHKEVIDEYTKLGVLCDKWFWTSSEWFLNYIETHKMQEEKVYDFICVLHPDSIRPDTYRGQMVKHIEKRGFTFTQGGGSGHDDNDIDRLIKYYCKSKITLGTSNCHGSNIRGIKGFRDWLGVACDVPLIYDNESVIMEEYNSRVPYYQYGNFDQLVDIGKTLINYPKIYYYYLLKQQQYLKENTIDKQLTRLLLKYSFITEVDLHENSILPTN